MFHHCSLITPWYLPFLVVSQLEQICKWAFKYAYLVTTDHMWVNLVPSTTYISSLNTSDTVLRNRSNLYSHGTWRVAKDSHPAHGQVLGSSHTASYFPTLLSFLLGKFFLTPSPPPPSQWGHLYFRLDIIIIKRLCNHSLNHIFFFQILHIFAPLNNGHTLAQVALS